MHNIIWIIVDSVRNYTCPAERMDERGRLAVMDELADKWVDFRTVVTSAPSTLMSMGTMFSGWPSYYVGSAFEDLRMSATGIRFVGPILARHGYRSFCVTHYRLGRECWAPIFDPVPRRLWPRGLKHRREWNNAQTNRVVFNLLNAEAHRPLFLFVHLECRWDPQIDQRVRDLLGVLEVEGLMDDSVVYLTSDHGYPDPGRQKEVARRRRELGMAAGEIAHDLVMTDDNVLIPLLVSCPGMAPRRIEQQICTLDYLPTALELAGVPERLAAPGVSVAPLMNGDAMPALEQRRVRIDGRFLAQKGRVTALRSRTHKYVIYPDENSGGCEEFYDLRADPLEVRNLARAGANGQGPELDAFRRAYRHEQDKAHAFLVEALGEKYRQQYAGLAAGGAPPRRVLYVRAGQPLFDELMERLLRRVFPDAVVRSSAPADLGDPEADDADLVSAAIATRLGNRALLRWLSRCRARRKLLVDVNVNVVRFSRLYFLSLFRRFWLKRSWYVREPMYFLCDVWAKLRGA